MPYVLGLGSIFFVWDLKLRLAQLVGRYEPKKKKKKRAVAILIMYLYISDHYLLARYSYQEVRGCFYTILTRYSSSVFCQEQRIFPGPS